MAMITDEVEVAEGEVIFNTGDQAEALYVVVDGSIEPDRWILERATGRVTERTPPGERRRLVAHGAQTGVEQVPPEHSASPPLNDAMLTRVFEAVRSAEAVFGAPQDVEWTVCDGRLVLLQSRPVTTSSSDEGDKRAWYLSLTRSLENLRGLRTRVEDERLPEMDREADAIAARDVAAFDADGLASEIESRRAAHDRWVDIYWQEFIPFAHGIRLFGQFYNDAVQPDDPHEFMNLLAGTPMLSVRRNRALEVLAEMIRSNPDLRRSLDDNRHLEAAFEEKLRAFETEYGGAVFADRACFSDRRRLLGLLQTMADAPVRTVTAASETDSEMLRERFFAKVPADRRELAQELLASGKVRAVIFFTSLPESAKARDARRITRHLRTR